MSTTAPITNDVPMTRMTRPNESVRPRKHLFSEADIQNDPGTPAKTRYFGESCWGLAISLVIHLSLLSGLTLIVFESRQTSDLGSISGLLGTDEDAPADFIIESSGSLDTGGSSEPDDLFSPTTTLRDFGELIGAPSMRGGNGEGDGAGDDEGDGAGIGIAVPTINVPGHAVTKGSFSAWTVPESPEVDKHYFIIIQVRLPENLIKKGKYRARDITGMVVGTDRYKQVIKFSTADVFEVKDGVVQLEVFVPGAKYALVKDTIRIQSKLLKEKQTLELVFTKKKPQG